jgi:hypothetical protein
MESDFWIYLAVGAWFLAGVVRKMWAEVSRQHRGGDGFQQPGDGLPEGSERERMLLESAKGKFVRVLEEARRRSAAANNQQDVEDAEERGSKEAQPKIVSMEQEVRRAPRREFTQDDDAENLVQRRIQAAAARDTAQSKVDHLEFDQRIRKEPADRTVSRGYTPQQLRQAVVWREILGPPVSLRDQASS